MHRATRHGWIFVAAVHLAGCAARQPVPAQPSAIETAAPASTVVASANAPSGQEDAKQPDDELIIEVDPKLICRDEKPTGSHIMERRCYMAEQLREMTDQSQEFLRSQGRRGSVYAPTHKKDPRNSKPGPN